MEKEQDQKSEINKLKENEINDVSEDKVTEQIISENREISLEDKILELEDKLTRTFAEMENQRRRFEKEKDEAFEYGGFTFAKEALGLIDNLERSIQILKNDDTLKNTEALKKTLEHFDIINTD